MIKFLYMIIRIFKMIVINKNIIMDTITIINLIKIGLKFI